MKKLTIAIDIDDVLSQSAHGFAQYSNQKWGSGITADDYCEDWAVTWKVTRELAAKRAEQYHQDAVVSEFHPIEGARDALVVLSKKHNLIVVTSRRLSIKPHTEEWLRAHFPGTFSKVVYAGMWDKQHASGVDAQLASTKTGICLSQGAHFIIDDQIKHCESASGVGVKALLFGDYSWNKTNDPLGPNVVRKSNWAEVLEHLGAK